jgi:hypothetical protein
MIGSAQDDMELGLGEDLLATMAQEAIKMVPIAILQTDSVLRHSLQTLVAMAFWDRGSGQGRTGSLVDADSGEADNFANSVGSLTTMTEQ